MSIISLYEKSENLYFVGGIVRDEILGIPSSDIDLTFVGNAIDFVKSLNFGEITQINEEFGSVHIKIDNQYLDISSTRHETYPNKGQLPVVNEIGCSLKKDVLRRDFTINSIAKNCKTNKIVDYVNGIEDLNKKQLRVLHDESFIDDPTRIIRGLKFAVRFGFELEKHTLELQNQYLSNVNYEMSYKRLKDELVDAFEINKQEVLNKFISQKMYKLLSKNEFKKSNCNIEKLIAQYKNEIKTSWIVYLGGFDLSNLPLTKNEKQIIDNYKKISNYEFTNEFEIYKTFKKVSIETLLIYAHLKDLGIVKKYLDNLRKIELSITGEDIKKLGYTPSKRFSECLDAVLKAKLENPSLNHAQELDIVKNFM
ncbi:MAG: hypothetical protein ACI4SM_02930 [Candidatus Gastranaerophilaceae bacterium]